MAENKSSKLASLGKNALLLTLFWGGGNLAAHLIINIAAGSFIGHIDAGCAASPECMNMVTESVSSLPNLLGPAIFGIAKSVKFVIDACSTHPDGGTNQSIKGNIE